MTHVLRVCNIEVDVRAGTPADVPVLLKFIGAMAEFEFHEGLCAEILPDWRICRVDEARLPGLAGNLAVSMDELDRAFPEHGTNMTFTRDVREICLE